MSRPERNTYSEFMRGYIALADGNTIQDLLYKYHEKIMDFYTSIPESVADHRYTEDKWTVREVISHVIDTDIIFGYRALCIAHGELQILPGFDQDQYAKNADAEMQNLDVLKSMFVAQRNLIKNLVLSFSEKQLAIVGKVSNYDLSVNAACYVLFGHALHHMQILKERYL